MIALDFTQDIDRLTEGFTGRQWLFAEIDRWLQARQQRFLLLTANPGVGKSAISAQLTKIRAGHILAYHFCIAGRNNTVVPGAILRSLAAQLARTLPDYSLALANTIKPSRLRVEVNIDVNTMSGGQITGVVIENLKPTDPETEIDILLRSPLAQISPPAHPSFILIDSLDEAATHRGEVNLVTLLAGAEDLPNWVRFICTSRPEGSVLSYFHNLEPYVLDAESAVNLADVAAYITRRVNTESITTRLGSITTQAPSLIERIAELAKGNFLYTQMLLDDIAAGRQQLDDLEALPKSLDDIYQRFLRRFTPREWQQRYKPLFSMLAVARQPITEEHLANFTDLKRGQVRDDLEVIRQFLTESAGPKGRPAYTLFHQSLREYLSDGERNRYFWCPPEEGHALVTQYGFSLKKQRGRWEASDDDGYLFDNLAHHLNAQADESPAAAVELKALFDDQEWMNARSLQSNDNFDGFISDLRLAWNRAHARAHEQIERGQPLVALADCVRYALIRTSFNSLSANYAPALVARAVELEWWSPSRTLSMAERILQAGKRAALIVALLQTGPMNAPGMEPVMQKAQEAGLKAALAIGDSRDLAAALASLAPHLTRAARETALQRGLEAALAIEQRNSLPGWNNLPVLDFGLEKFRAEILSSLAPYLTGRLLPQSLEALKTLKDDEVRARFLASLAPQLEGELLQQGLEIALAIGDKAYRAIALANLALQLEEKAKGRYIRRSLKAALAEDNEPDKVEAITNLAPHLKGKVKERALQQGLELALALKYAETRAEALCKLAPLLEGKQKKHALQEGLEAALAIWSDGERAYALANLAPHLTGALVEQVLEAALAIQDEEYRADIITNLAPQLEGDWLQKALEAALAMKDKKSKAKTLAGLAPRFAGDEKERALQQGLEAALAIEREGDRDQALAYLAPQLSGELLRQGLEAALTIEDEHNRVIAISRFLSHLEGEAKQRALKQGMEIALKIGPAWSRAAAIWHLAPYLEGEAKEHALQEGLQTALTVENQWDRLTAIINLVPHLEGEAKERALQHGLRAASKVGDPLSRLTAFANLARDLEGEARENALQQALEADLAIYDEWEKIQALGYLAPRLDGNVLKKGLEAALAFDFDFYKAEVLSHFAPQLEGNYLQQGFEAALAMEDKEDRVKLLAALIPRLSGEAREGALQMSLKEARTIKEKRARANSFTALAPLLSGKAQEQSLRIALHAARAIQDESERVISLAALAPQLSGEARSEALQTGLNAARAIQDEKDRANSLALLAPLLSGEARQEALHMGLNAAGAITNRKDRAEALVQFLPLLNDQAHLLGFIRRYVLDELLGMQNLKREQVLNFLSKESLFTPTILNVPSDTLEAFTNHIMEICNDWKWQ